VASPDRHELVEAGRRRAALTVSNLWLRYVALGGNGDMFDVDAYLSGLVPLSTFDEDVLAVAVNERLEEVLRAARVPLAAAPSVTPPDADLREAVARLLDLGPRRDPPPPDDGARGTA
jgi:hypothetical protein